ncbi:MAG: hypothetical protein MUC31_05840, partial [Bacteroidales bacterium]|nr:hypothetical protein [Bacteroidales bacterium]
MQKPILFLFFLLPVMIVTGQEFSLTHDGLLRTYRLHSPAGYQADSLYPLVINMHGLGSNAFEQEFYTSFNDVADSAGFFVAYPNGIDETWNISSTGGTDDVGFISALIDTVGSEYSIDFDRVFATGMSMGGFMSYRLACELSDRIAAIASVTGLQAFYPCDPGRPVPVLQFHGTADPVVPYSGVPATIANWVDHNVCPADPIITDLPDIDTTDNSTVTISYYGLCENSTEVILYTINNGGHTWPGAFYIIGVTNQDIMASYEIWDFFSKYTLQGSTGIETETKELSAIKFYPNPVQDIATVELNGKILQKFDFRIFDMTGKMICERPGLMEPRFLIDCSRIPAGMYLAVLSSGSIQSY